MTRRNAVLALASVVGVLTEDARAQLVTFKLPPPGRVSFNLRAYTAYEFSLDGEKVTLTPEQMMAALKSEGE